MSLPVRRAGTSTTPDLVGPWALGVGMSALPTERLIAVQGARAWKQLAGKTSLSDAERAKAIQVGLGLDGLYDVDVDAISDKLEPYVSKVQEALLTSKAHPETIGKAVYDALTEADRDVRAKPLRVLATIGLVGLGYIIWQGSKARPRRRTTHAD